MLVMLLCILSTAVIIVWLLKLVFTSAEQASFRQLWYKKLYAFLYQEQIVLRPCMKFIHKDYACILQNKIGGLMFSP